MQGDGKIVAAGASTAFELARYNADGSLDATFGTGGKVTTAQFGARAIALQGDGKIVAAGSTDTDTQTAFALARYLCDNIVISTTTSTTIPTPTTTTSSTSTTRPSTPSTTTSTTISTASTTTTSLAPSTTSTLPCTSARRALATALMNPACTNQTIPPSVTGKFSTAATLIDQAATTPGKKGRNIRQKAKMLLKQAGTAATRAAKGKNRKLTGLCAAALKNAARGVATGL